MFKWSITKTTCSACERVKKRRGGDTLEIDVLVVNTGHVVMVEVKASLSVEAVREFLDDLR